MENIYEFDGENGMYPEGEVISYGGRYFGLTQKGSKQNYGTVYEFFPNSNTVELKTDFYKGLGGLRPMGSLVLGANKKFYGVTYREGSEFRGSLFEFDPLEKVFMIKTRFPGIHSQHFFYASITNASNGNIYGFQQISNVGAFLFEYEPGVDSIHKKIFFRNQEGGGSPIGEIKELKKNKLYGMTQSGGLSRDGALFEYDFVMDEYKLLASLLDSTTGSHPMDGPILFDNGKLFCTAFGGGENDLGTLLEYSFDTNNLTKKFDFDSINGSNPYHLINGKNGKIYGVTTKGGVHNSGVLFEYDPESEKLNVKYNFEDSPKPKLHNLGKLTLGKNGKIYGLFSDGSNSNHGFLFEFDQETGALKKKILFDNHNVGKNPLYGHLISVDFCRNFQSFDTVACEKFISPTGKI